MDTPRGISRQPVSPSLDFNKLRKEALTYVQALSSNEWTDYNLHDPGVTILETLCYSLTDLAYRTDFLHESFTGAHELPQHAKHFFTGKQLKESAPFTKLDFERYIERTHPDVLYAWVEEEPLFSQGNIVLGGYEVTIMFAHHPSYGNLNTDRIRMTAETGDILDIILFDESNERINWKNIKKVVGCKWDTEASDNFVVFEVHNCQVALLLEVIYQNRTQADSIFVKARVSFSKITRTGKKKFDVESQKGAVVKQLESEQFLRAIEELLVKETQKDIMITILKKSLLSCRNLCEDFVSIRVANEQEVRIDVEIMLNDFAPPASDLLIRIFQVLDDFLLRLVFDSKEHYSNKKSVLYGSNIIEEIMKLEGIAGVRILSMNLYIDGVPTVSLKDALAFECIQLQRFSEFAPKMSVDKSTITFLRADMKEEAELSGEANAYQNHPMASRMSEDMIPEPPSEVADLPSGLFDYHSIQNDFPLAYRLQEPFTKDTESDIAEVKRKQFKGYLLFFEKMIVEYLQSLKGFHELLSVNQDAETHHDEFETLRKILPDIDQLNLIDEPTWQEWRASHRDELSEVRRKHKILDHLLARYASPFMPLPVGNPDAEQLKKILQEKVSLLRNIPEITRDRGLGLPLGVDDDIWDSEGLLSGFQKRVYRLLGIDESFMKHLRHSEGKSKEPTGFYIVEHILLVTKDNRNIIYKKFNSAATILYDYIMHMSREYSAHPPYSFQLTIVLPNWYPAWRNRKGSIEKKIRAEIPAHILPYFHWLNKKNMSDFETCYEDWLKALIQLHDYPR
jgi:hypothetical protein